MNGYRSIRVPAEGGGSGIDRKALWVVRELEVGGWARLVRRAQLYRPEPSPSGAEGGQEGRRPPGLGGLLQGVPETDQRRLAEPPAEQGHADRQDIVRVV